MPVVHITLECATPTGHADGAFRTLVAVTDAQLHEGAHLREAVRRALIVGFGGPHRVLAFRRLDSVTPEVPTYLAAAIGQRAGPSMSERLESLLALGTPTANHVPESHADSQPAGRRRQQFPRGARTRG